MALIPLAIITYFLKKFLFAIALSVCLILVSCSHKENPDKAFISAQVVRVVSGQTIEVIIPQKSSQPQKVRMIGIDVPKMEDEQWSDRAKQRLEKLLTDNQVNLELESDQLDRYDRLLAHVWHQDTLIGEQLAKEGYVVANAKYLHRYSDRIFHAQEYARILGYGIWQ